MAALCGLALLPAIGNAQNRRAVRARSPKSEAPATNTASEPKLPAAVQKALDARFPNAKVEKADPEKEGGVTVYDIEFREGKMHKETDIAEDGTMLEITVFVAKNAVPKEAMKPITKAAEGAKMGRIEKVEITHEAKDGKVVKLDKAKTHYAVEMTKGDESAEIVVDAQGKVVEEPKWHAAKKETKSAA